jgi:hypothetical protein
LEMLNGLLCWRRGLRRDGRRWLMLLGLRRRSLFATACECEDSMLWTLHATFPEHSVGVQQHILDERELEAHG